VEVAEKVFRVKVQRGMCTKVWML